MSDFAGVGEGELRMGNYDGIRILINFCGVWL